MELKVEFVGQNDPTVQGVIELVPFGQKKPGRQDTHLSNVPDLTNDIVSLGQSIGVTEPDGQYELAGHSKLTDVLGQKKPAGH